MLVLLLWNLAGVLATVLPLADKILLWNPCLWTDPDTYLWGQPQLRSIPSAYLQRTNVKCRTCTWWRHQMVHFPRYCPFVRGIHRSPMNSSHKGQWRGASFLQTIILKVFIKAGILPSIHFWAYYLCWFPSIVVMSVQPIWRSDTGRWNL